MKHAEDASEHSGVSRMRYSNEIFDPPYLLNRRYKGLEVFLFLGFGPIDSNTLAKPFALYPATSADSSGLLVQFCMAFAYRSTINSSTNSLCIPRVYPPFDYTSLPDTY
jgi:hypothetical protein